MTDAERIDIIRDLTAKGLSCAKIAPFGECSAAQVNIIQKRLGIQRTGVKGIPDLKRPDEAEFVRAFKQNRYSELAIIYGVTTATISRWALHYGLRQKAPPRGPYGMSTQRKMSRADCTRKIAGDFSPRAIERALAKMGAR